MDFTTFTLAAVAALAAVTWLARRQLAAQIKSPTPRFLRWSRATGRAAALVSGVLSLVLVWAGIAAPGVSWLYALLGAVVLGLTLVLFLPRPGGRR